jgi:hypothetical protein
MRPGVVEGHVHAPSLGRADLRAPLQVIEPNRGVHGAGQSAPADPHAKIGILEIADDIDLVEPAQLVRKIAAHEHAGGGDGAAVKQCRTGGRLQPLARVVREHPAAELIQGFEIHALVLHGAVLEQEQRADGAQFRISFQPP